MIDGDIFKLSVPFAEILLRGTVVYWFLYLLLRFVLRRDGSSVGIGDLLFVVLLGDASQNAMIGDGKTVADGLLLIATLAFWNFSLDWLSFRSLTLRSVLQARRMTLYENGQRNRKAMRREMVTEEELRTELHMNGLDSLDQAKAIYLEPSGEITVVEKK